MKESLWGYYLVLLGITVSTVMILISNMTTTSQQDYYLLKEVTRASMIDSVDYGYYRKYGETKINTQKFVENFIRRFSEGISKTNTYKLEFYSIYENPPSVSIRVTSNTGEFHIEGDSTNIDVVNTIDAILETNNVVTVSQVLYSIPYGSCDENNYIMNNYKYCHLMNRAKLNLDDLKGSNVIKDLKKKTNTELIDLTKLKILNVEFLKVLDSAEDINNYNNLYGYTYDRPSSLDDIPNDLISSKVEESKYFAKNVENVQISFKNDSNGNYYLGYGLDYNCDKKGDDVVNKFYYYRPTKDNLSKYLSDNDKREYYKGSDYITPYVYSKLPDEQKSDYEKAPFYNSCLVGIKYKVNFYYDGNA